MDRWHRAWIWGERAPFFMRRRGLRHIILYILASRSPLTGSQIAEEIERMTWGFWRPSPGSIYPALAQLEAEGLIRVAKTDGPKKYYELTEEGRRLLGIGADYIKEAVLAFENLYNFLLDNLDKLDEESKNILIKIANELLKNLGKNT
ncbi:MAG: PadR family transcriptional regulator [Thermoproteus sp.]